MADVKWIRFIIGMFDGQSFKRIKRASIGGVAFRDKLTAIWFELLDLAAKCNNNGFLLNIADDVAYKTFNDIAIMIDRDEKEVELCINYFITEKMIEIVDDCYCLSNWTKYQNNAGLQNIQEYNRIKQQESRSRKKKNILSLTINDSQESSSISISNSLSNKVQDIFNALWGINLRKVNKEQARKSFLKAMKECTTEIEVRNKGAMIYNGYKKHMEEWSEEDNGKGRKQEHIPHLSTWLNANIPEKIIKR